MRHALRPRQPLWRYWLVDPGPRVIRRRSDIYRPRRHRRIIYEPFPPAGGGFLLQENGDKLLMENGVDAILLE